MNILTTIISGRRGRVAAQAIIGLVTVLAAVLVALDGTAWTVLGVLLIALIAVLAFKLALIAERRTAYHADALADLRVRNEQIGTLLRTSIARLDGEHERLATATGSTRTRLDELADRVQQLANRFAALADDLSTTRSEARQLTDRIDVAEDAIARRLPPDAQEAAVVVRQVGPAMAQLAALHGEILEIHDEVERLRRQVGRAEPPIEPADG